MSQAILGKTKEAHKKIEGRLKSLAKMYASAKDKPSEEETEMEEN